MEGSIVANRQSQNKQTKKKQRTNDNKQQRKQQSESDTILEFFRGHGLVCLCNLFSVKGLEVKCAFVVIWKTMLGAEEALAPAVEAHHAQLCVADLAAVLLLLFL